MATVQHRIVSSRRLAKGESGWTQLGSQRLDSVSAIDWVIDHAPEGIFTVEPGEHETVIRVDLDKAETLEG